jgi:hypothetical protein
MTEEVVDAELLKLVKRPPRTTAEKKFYQWMKDWKIKLEEARKTHAYAATAAD